MSERLKFVSGAIVDEPCCFCEGGKFSIGAVTVKGDEVPSVVHSIPVCAKFRSMDPTLYLRAVNRERARRAGLS